MSRWTYLIPRMVILCLILGAIWLGRDPLIQRLLIREAQNITGAQVEIAQVHSSFSNKKLFFKDLKIADPRNPMKNLVQADMAYVQLNPGQLLRRQFVIEQGRTSELIFGAPRTDSGALPETQQSSIHYPASTNKQTSVHDYESDLAKKGQLWLDQIPSFQSTVDMEEFEIVKLARQSLDHWENQLVNQRAKVAKIKPAIAKLQSVLNTNSGNPLRDPGRYSEAKIKLKQLEVEAAQIRTNIREMQMKIAQEKQALTVAKTRDQQKLRQMTPTNMFDSDSMSQLMLYRSQAQLVDEVVQWFRWFRSAIPDPYQHLSPKSNRGVKVAFKSVTPRPGFLIKQLDLEGEGRFAGQHLNFAGTAFNLTTQPSLHSEPASFELRAQGNQHVIVNCEIDRRDQVPSDKLHIQCPNLAMEAQTLGHPDSILVSMGPGSRVQAEIELQMNGEQLSGRLVFQHSQVSLHVDQLNELAGGPDTALRLNQDLAKINQYKTEVHLSGSLDNYQFQFGSDLGSKFAATAERVVTSAIEQKLSMQKSRLDEILTNTIETLDQSVAGELAELAEQLQQNKFIIAELKESIEQPSNRPWPKIRR